MKTRTLILSFFSESSELDSLNLLRNDHRIVLAQLFAFHRFVVETACMRRCISMFAAEHATATACEAGETDTFLACMTAIGLLDDIYTERIAVDADVCRFGRHRRRLLKRRWYAGVDERDERR